MFTPERVVQPTLKSIAMTATRQPFSRLLWQVLGVLTLEEALEREKIFTSEVEVMKCLKFLPSETSGTMFLVIASSFPKRKILVLPLQSAAGLTAPHECRGTATAHELRISCQKCIRNDEQMNSIKAFECCHSE